MLGNQQKSSIHLHGVLGFQAYQAGSMKLGSCKGAGTPTGGGGGAEA